MPDVSALGAAYLAGLKTRLYKDLAYSEELNAGKSTIVPSETTTSVAGGYTGWQAAIAAN